MARVIPAHEESVSVLSQREFDCKHESPTKSSEE